MRVGGAVIHRIGFGFIEARVAEDAEQPLAGGALGKKFGGADPAILQAGLAVGDAHRKDHAVAIEDMVAIIGMRRKLRVGAVAVEGAGQPGGQAAFHHQVGSVELGMKRRVIAIERRIIAKRADHHTSPITRWPC